MDSAGHLEPTAKVFERDGEVFATSRDVATHFEKELRHVHEAIRHLIGQEPRLGLVKFRPIKIRDLTGESTSHYEMDRDGFTLLCMGFTGPKALRFKLQYIEAFNEMESEIGKRAARPSIDLNDPAALRGLLLTYSEKTIELEAQIEDLKPSKEALNRIAEADGSFCITDAAKALQMRPKDLFAWMRQNGWIYRRSGSGHDLGYQAKVITGVLEHKVKTIIRDDGTEKVVEQVRVTAKGMTKLATLVKPQTQPA